MNQERTKKNSGMLKTLTVHTDELIPAAYNPRKKLQQDDPEYQKIKNSIEQFGYTDPIIINQDMTVIGGHQRLQVLKDLGIQKITVVQVDLNKQQEKALNLALNKITGEWDKAVLSDVLLDLSEADFDLELTGFELDEIDSLIGEHPEKPNERIRTTNTYNLDLYYEEETDGFYQMPVIQNDHVIPDQLIGFNYAMSSQNKKTGIHCFVDDYQFERLWNQPDKYIEMLPEYQVVFSPDFSLYLDMPMAMKIWNVYRSRLLGQYWQSNGIKVIPTVSWAEPATFSFCFDGIPEGSIVAVSTIGVKREEGCFQIWKDGMNAMIEKIQPSTILVYGGELEFDYQGIPVKYFENQVTKRMSESKKEE